MADGKNSIIIYRDWKDIFEKLTDDEAGKLIKHLFRYVNDENPCSDRLIELVFEPIKQTLKRDLKHWELVRLKRSESGKKGGENSGRVRKQNEANEANASKYKANEANVKQNEANVKQNEANEAVSVSVIVSDSVSVNDKINISIEDRKKLNDEILMFFGFKIDDPKSIPHQRNINRFLSELFKLNLIDVFKEQFEWYQKYKVINPKFNYSLKNFLFDEEMNAENGGWNSNDWKFKLKEVQQEQKPKSAFENFK